MPSLRHFDAHPPPACAAIVGHDVRLGKLPAKKDKRTLQLARYIDKKALPRPRGRVQRSQLVPSWPMYANDRLGDCTLATVGHMIEAWSYAAGRPLTPAEEAIVAGYWATGSADDGRYEIDVLNWWRNAGVEGETLTAYVQVATKRHDLVKIAVQLFGGLYIGIALPVSAQHQRVWSVARGADAQPGSWGGHAVNVVDYGPTGLVVVTWGATLRMTWGFWDRYVDEAYALVHPRWFDQGGLSPKDAGAVKMDALLRDLAEVTS